jgi:hypothetical protein
MMTIHITPATCGDLTLLAWRAQTEGKLVFGAQKKKVHRKTVAIPTSNMARDL